MSMYNTALYYYGFFVIMFFVEGKNVDAIIPLGKPYLWLYACHQPPLHIQCAYSTGKCSCHAITCMYMYVLEFFEDWGQGKAK